jgi:SAM-dependent methyltransferase
MLETLTKCPVCMSVKHYNALSMDGYYDGTYHLCDFCGALFLSPRMDEKEAFEFYRSGKYRKMLAEQGAGKEKAIQQHSERASYISELLEKSTFESHLDIGCSSGELLREIKRTHPGIFSMGVDPDPELATTDFPVVSSLEKVTQEFGLITLIQTLEHINEPMKIMSAIWDKLLPGGGLVVEVPNRRATMTAYIPPQHVVAYDSASLRLLLSRFKVVRELLHGKPYNSPLDLSILIVATK